MVALVSMKLRATSYSLLPSPHLSTAILAGLVLAKLALHLLTAPGYGLHRDEYLYLDMGRHLAWGYKEIPPLLAPLAALSRALGTSGYAVRLFPALFGAATVGLAGLIVRALRGGWFATLTAGLAVGILPVLLVMHHLFQPNFLDVFCWTLYGYLLVRLIHEQQPRWLLWLGVAMGLGMLAKYSTAFYGLALVPAVLLSPGLRPWLFTRWTTLALGAALLLFLPNLAWQATHHWPVVGHMNKLQETQLGNVNPLDFLLDQVGMTLPGVLLWMAGLAFTFTRAGRPYQVLSLTFVFLIGMMLLTHGKNYYTAGIYPPLIALGAVALERWLAGQSILKIVGRTTLLFLIPLTVVRLFPVLVPIFPLPQLATYVRKLVRERPQFEGVVRWEDGQLHDLPQDVADMRGWPEYAPLAAKALARLSPAERAHCLLYGDNYGQAGAANWYGPQYGLPVCHSLNGSYSLWMPDSLGPIQAVIYLNEGALDDKMAPRFRHTEIIGVVQDPYARTRGAEVVLYREPIMNFTKLVRQRTIEARDGFE